MRFLIVTFVVLNTYLADIGEPCQGFSGIQCKPQLVCMVPSKHQHTIDGAGICVKASSLEL